MVQLCSQLIRGIVEVIRMGFTAYLRVFNKLYIKIVPCIRPAQGKAQRLLSREAELPRYALSEQNQQILRKK